MRWSAVVAVVFVATFCSRAQAQRSITVTVSPKPVTLCTNQSQTFNATYTATNCFGNPVYQWSVDGTTIMGATSSSYTTSFASAGSHTVSCQVNLGNCLPGSDTSNVTVINCSNGGCVPNLSATSNPNPSCVGDQVQFNAQIQDNCAHGALSWDWDFGDGTAHSTLQNPTHTYASAGTFNVTCSVTDGANYSAMKTLQQTVKTKGIVGLSATATPNPACIGESIAFHASASENCGPGTITYSWNFGDGTTGSGADVNHTYSTANTYNVTCTATDGTYSANTSIQVTIKAPGISGLTATASPNPACAGTAVSFSASATENCPRLTITYSWTFGDGGTGSGQAVSHTYASPGNYNATVTASDGTTSMMTSIQVVVNGPSVTINSVTANPNPATTCDTITFNASASPNCTGAGVTYSWNFGDGSTATGASVSHQYLSPATYMVTVTATSGTASAFQTIQVGVSACAAAKINTPGSPPGNDPYFCLGGGGISGASINVRTGNLRCDIYDPVPTRGFPLTCNIYLNSQWVENSRPMGSAAFTYDMHVTTQPVYDAACTSHLHTMVVDTDGTRLDYFAGYGVYSTLNQDQQTGAWTLWNAGPPGDVGSRGNWVYNFNAAGRLNKITDPGGNIQWVSCESYGPTLVWDNSTSRTIKFEYTNGKVSRVIQGGFLSNPTAGAEFTELTYSGNHLSNVVIKNAAGTVLTSVQTVYNGDGTLGSITRDNDSTSTITFSYTPYPSLDCQTPVMLANVASPCPTNIHWGDPPLYGAFETVKVTNSYTGVTKYTFNGVGDLTYVDTPPYNGGTAGSHFYLQYNSKHQVISATDGRTTEQATYHSESGLPTSFFTSALGGGVTWNWSYRAAFSQDLETAQAPGLPASLFLYQDPFNSHMVSGYTDESNLTWHTARNPFGQVTGITPPGGSPTGSVTIAYDEQAGSPTIGYPTGIADGNGDMVTFDAYDALGDLLQFTSYPVHGDSSVHNSYQFSYDALQRITGMAYPDGHTLQWFYNGRNLDHTVDEAGTQYNYTFCSPCGALTSIAGPLGWSLGWTFDCDKNLRSFRDARNKVTDYGYGLAGELQSIHYPDNSTTYLNYDLYGYPSSVINGNNQTLGVSINNGLLTSVTDASDNSTLLYYTYNSDGALSTASGPGAGWMSVSYLNNGLVSSVVYNWTNQGFWPNTVSIVEELDYAYYPDGRRSSLTWKNNGTVVGTWTYQYDLGGRLVGVANSWSEQTSWSYDGEGKIKSQTNANGTSTQITYNESRGWPTSITHKLGANTFASYNLTYDGGANSVGNLTHVSDWDGSQVGYSYDALYRLTAEARTGTNPVSHSFQYDLAGNPTNVDGIGYSFDNANKFTNSNFAYDGDGNLTRYGPGYYNTSVYTWNKLGQLASQGTQSVGPNITGVLYCYDGFGKRVSSQRFTPSIQNSKTFYVFDGDLLLGEVRVDDAGTYFYPQVTAAYTWGANGLVSERAFNTPTWGTRSYFYHFGPQGETRCLTWPDGTIVDTYNYSAYGSLLTTPNSTIVNPFLYGGQFGYYTDRSAGNTGIMLCGARWYSPSIQRWLNRDPAGFVGGPNLYEYCGSNPATFSDPSGMRRIGGCPGDRWLGPRGEGSAMRGGVRGDWLNHLSDLSAGWGDSLSRIPLTGYSVTGLIRQGLGVDGQVDYGSGWYAAGEGAAFVHSLLMLKAGMSVGSASGAAPVAAAQSTTQANEGIYVVDTISGLKYVGQSGDIDRRLAEHVANQVITRQAAANATRIQVLGGKTAREISEQNMIDLLGGVGNLANIRNPIGRARFNLMPPGYSR